MPKVCCCKTPVKEILDVNGKFVEMGAPTMKTIDRSDGVKASKKRKSSSGRKVSTNAKDL